MGNRNEVEKKETENCETCHITQKFYNIILINRCIGRLHVCHVTFHAASLVSAIAGFRPKILLIARQRSSPTGSLALNHRFRNVCLKTAWSGGRGHRPLTSFGVIKLDWLPFHVVSKFQLYVLSVLHKAHMWQVDERTDRQMDRQNYDPQDCASIAASRGKNRLRIAGVIVENKVAPFPSDTVYNGWPLIFDRNNITNTFSFKMYRFIRGTLQLHYKFRCRHMMLSVCCLSSSSVLWQNGWSKDHAVFTKM